MAETEIAKPSDKAKPVKAGADDNLTPYRVSQHDAPAKGAEPGAGRPPLSYTADQLAADIKKGDSKSITEHLTGMSSKDERDELQKEFQEKYKISSEDAIKGWNHFGNVSKWRELGSKGLEERDPPALRDDSDKAVYLLHRENNNNPTVDRLGILMDDVKHGRDPDMVQKNLVDAAKILRPEDIAKLPPELVDGLRKDVHLSAESREKLNIYLDNPMGSSGRSPQGTDALMHIALGNRSYDEVADALNLASPEARKAYQPGGSMHEFLKSSFMVPSATADQQFVLKPGPNSDKVDQLAKNGCEDTATRLREHQNWLKTNDGGVDLVLKGMSDDERAMYGLGFKAAKGEKIDKIDLPDGKSEDDCRKLYGDIHQSLQDALPFISAGGTASAKMAKYEGEILYPKTTILQKLDAHAGHLKSDGADSIAGEFGTMSDDEKALLKPGADPIFRELIERSVRAQISDDSANKIFGEPGKAQKADTDTSQNSEGSAGAKPAVKDALVLHESTAMSKTEWDNFTKDNAVDPELAKLLKDGSASASPHDLLEKLQKITQLPSVQSELNDPNSRKELQRSLRDFVKLNMSEEDFSKFGLPALTGHSPDLAHKVDLAFYGGDKAALYRSLMDNQKPEERKALGDALTDQGSSSDVGKQLQKSFSKEELQVLTRRLKSEPGAEEPLADQVREYQLGLTSNGAELAEKIQGLGRNDVHKGMQEFSQVYQGDMEHLLGASDDAKKIVEALNKPYDGALQRYYDFGAKVQEANQGLGSPLTKLIGTDGGQSASDVKGDIERRIGTSTGDAVNNELQEKFKDADKALDLYKEDKKDVADEVVNGFMMAAAPYLGSMNVARLAATAVAEGMAGSLVKGEITGDGPQLGDAINYSAAALGTVVAPGNVQEMLKVGEKIASDTIHSAKVAGEAELTAGQAEKLAHQLASTIQETKLHKGKLVSGDDALEAVKKVLGENNEQSEHLAKRIAEDLARSGGDSVLSRAAQRAAFNWAAGATTGFVAGAADGIVNGRSETDVLEEAFKTAALNGLLAAVAGGATAALKSVPASIDGAGGGAATSATLYAPIVQTAGGVQVAAPAPTDDPRPILTLRQSETDAD